MPPTYYRGFWHVVSSGFLVRYCQLAIRRGSSLTTVVYDPKALIPHAALRRQAFAHCERFLVAAIRRCVDRVSVLLWGYRLSPPLPVIGLVGHYPTNYLIGRRLLLRRVVTPFPLRLLLGLIRDYLRFRGAILDLRADSHALLSRLPLSTSEEVSRSTCMPNPRRQRSS